jgi:hypothetical protein
VKHKKDSELYLNMYPELLKWINECPICRSKGYKPEMPEHIGGEYSIAAYNIRKYFKPLEVEENGFCLQCSKVYNQKKMK